MYDIGDGFTIHTLIEQNGSAHYWVCADDQTTGCPKRQIPAHERLGPLPAEIRRRVLYANPRPRCGRPTRSGKPCRNGHHVPLPQVT
jgi:hypothetical protein